MINMPIVEGINRKLVSDLEDVEKPTPLNMLTIFAHVEYVLQLLSEENGFEYYRVIS